MELAIKPHISGTGAIDDTNKTKLTSIGTKAVFNWQDKTASKVLSSGNIFSDLKLARQGTSLVATSSTSTAIGKFDLKITFLSLDKKLQKDASLKLGLKVGEVEGALEPANTQASRPGNRWIEALGPRVERRRLDQHCSSMADDYREVGGGGGEGLP